MPGCRTSAMRKFLAGAWPTIEQFPQFMAMNLKKLSVGDSPGEDLARRYLIRNIRVEQKHAEHWVDWAKRGRPDARRPEAGRQHRRPRARWPTGAGTSATGRACRWRSRRPTTRSKASTGEWSCVVCSESTYADSLPEEIRGPATRWLRAARRVRRQPSLGGARDRRHPARPLAAAGRDRGGAAGDPLDLRLLEMGLNHAAAGLLHGSFDETASNASTLGALDAA